MRRVLVSIAIVLMLVTIGSFVAARHGVKVPLISQKRPPRPRDAGVPARRAQVSDAAVDAAPAPPPRLLDRPLRIVATDWEVIAPMILASRGLTSVSGSIVDRARLETEIKVVAQASEVEEALARGGGERGGADVAVVPLATWVSSYEHLAALAPQAFFAVAWSRGSESFFIMPSASAEAPFLPSFALAADRTSTAALTLMLLAAEMNVAPTSVHVVPFEAPEALVSAADREDPSAELAARGRTPLFTTADAARISPWVVIAPRAFQTEHPEALVAFASAWTEGNAELVRDVPLAARTIAAMEGAPPVIELLRRLGRIEPITLGEQAELFGLSGRGAVTLTSLFSRAWVSERGLGALIGPPPESTPIATTMISTLVLRDPRAIARPAARTATTSEQTLLSFPFEPPRSARDIALAEPLVARVGFVAGVFARSKIRVLATRAQTAAARAILDQAIERYGLDPARIELVTGTANALRVLAPS